jgi:MFS family permease
LLARVLEFRKYFSLLIFLFLFQLARGMTYPLFPQYYQSINLSAIDIGLAFAAYGISFLIFEALWGFVFERYGIRGTMPPLAIALTTVAVLLFARPSDLIQLLGIESLLGIGLGGAGVFPRLAVARQARYADRGKVFGMLSFTYSVGATLGALLGGASGSLIGISKSFIIAAAFTLLSVIPIWWSNRSQSEREEPVLTNPGPVASEVTESTRYNRMGIVVLFIVGLTAVAGNSFFSLLLPNILLKTPRLSASVLDISIVIAAFNLSTGLAAPFTASRGSRSPAKWITACLVGTGICYFAIIPAQNVTEIEIVTIIMGVAYSALTPLTLSLLTTFVPKGHWGRIIGIYGAAEDVGILVGTSVGSFVWGIYGSQYSLIMMSVLYILVGLICFSAARSGKLGQNTRSISELTG